MNISLFVPGIPQPQGSKRLLVNPHTEQPVLIEDARQARPWRQAIRSALHDLDTQCVFGEVHLELEFRFARPLTHFGTGKNIGVLKDSKRYAPYISAPDIDKLSRAVLDALTGVIYHDDRQVTELKAWKRYDGDPGVFINVWHE